jgi:hypothetical protein
MDERQLLLEAWKQTIDTQMRFNDIAMKIRAFALTLVAAVLTAEALVSDPQGYYAVLGLLVVWIAFYLMDRWWYHYLLLGAVLHGSALEDRARELGLALPGGRSLLGLTQRISALNREALGLNAKYKLDIYYGLVLLALLLILWARADSWV